MEEPFACWSSRSIKSLWSAEEFCSTKTIGGGGGLTKTCKTWSFHLLSIKIIPFFKTKFWLIILTWFAFKWVTLWAQHFGHVKAALQPTFSPSFLVIFDSVEIISVVIYTCCCHCRAQHCVLPVPSPDKCEGLRQKGQSNQTRDS